ncbi:hypothetical protein ACT7DA_30830 [Bacillus pacificus]
MNLDEDMGQNPNELALKEIMDFINLQDSIQKQIRVEILTSRFNEKPYGWRVLDIQRLIVELLKDQKIRLRYNSEYLEPEDDANKIVTVLTKSSEANKGIIIKRKVVAPELIRVARKVCKEVFNKTDLPDDEDGLVKEIRLLIEKQVNEIESYKTRYEGRKYPGMSLLNKGLEYFGEFHKGVDNASFFAKMKELQKDLSYWEEDMAYLKSFLTQIKGDI